MASNINSILKLKVYSNQLTPPFEYLNQNTQDRSAKGDVLPHACSRSCDRKKCFLFWIVSITRNLTTRTVNKLKTLDIANNILYVMGACFNLNLLFLQQQDVGGAKWFQNIWWSTFPLESMVEVARRLEKKKHGEKQSWSCRDPGKQKKGCLKIWQFKTRRATLPKINTHCPWT